MDVIDPIRALLSFGFVLALMGACAFLAKRFLVRSGYMPNVMKSNRLAVVELKMVDAKHKLVMLRADEKEHVVLLGGSEPLLLQTQAALEQKNA